MTWSRQQRHKARAAVLAEPYRQASIEAALRSARAAGEEVLLRGRGATGRPTVIEPGVRVVVVRASGSTSVPWGMIEGVLPWPPRDADG